MTTTDTSTSAIRTAAAPLPRVSGSYRQRLAAVQRYHTGGEWVRDQGHRVADLHLGPRNLVPQVAFAVSPQAAHDVLGRHDDVLDKYMMFNLQRRLLGAASRRPSDDIFHMAYLPWLSRKRTLQPVFTKPRVSTYAGRIAGAAEDTAEAWIRSGTVDLGKATRALTLEVLGRSVFGLHLGERAAALEPVVQTFMTYPLRRSLRPVRSPAWLPTPARSRFFRAWDAVDAISDEALALCRQDPDHEAPLIRQLLAATDPETGRPLTDEERRADLMAFLLAGHDTTSTTLAYALWQLGRDAELQERVAAEVAAVGDDPLTADDVKQLPFTVQLIHEVLRLCPPAAGIARMSMRDVEIDGHLVPAGYNVVVPIYALHRDPTLWEDPERFDPERFAPARMKCMDRWQFLPFGGGPRSCIGDHFAMLEATLALTTILRAATVESMSAEFPLALAATLTAGGPVPVRVKRRKRLASHSQATPTSEPRRAP